MQTKWGIVATAVVMFFVAMILGQTSFARYPNPAYLFVWVMVGWYGYKGDYQSIKNWMKWLIWLSITGLLFINFFIGDASSLVVSDVKHSAMTFIAIKLIPLISLYYYCSFKLKEEHDADFGRTSISESQSKTSAYASSAVNKSTSSIEDLKLHDDEIFFEKALEEYVSNRRKGMWIKILSKNEGDESKSKFEYIRIRAEEIQQEHSEIKKEQETIKEKIREDSLKDELLLRIKIGNIEKITIKEQDCFLLDNGKVLYQMKSGDYLIYKDQSSMGYYLQYMQKNSGYVGVLKKNDVQDVLIKETKKANNGTDDIAIAIAVCRKCTLRLRVNNSTGMIKCPECGHSWLFEKKDEQLYSSISKNNTQKSPKLNIKKAVNIFVSEIKIFFGDFNIFGKVAIALMAIIIGVSLLFP